MKISVDKALQVCGNNNRYQKLLLITVILSWFSVDFVAISFPLLELMPNFQCKNENGEWINCTEKDICKLPKEEYIREVIYNNIVTEFNLECEESIIIMVGVIYTLGIVVGAILASKFSDVIGRKPVLLISLFLYLISSLALTFLGSIIFVLVLLFFVGIASAGGTMVSYLYIYEVLATNYRSVYGTLINSAFAVAGLCYFTAFKYLKDWRYITYISDITATISILMVLFYFTESPRYLLAKGETEKALKCLYKIATKNGKTKDFYRYLVSDLSVDINSDKERKNITNQHKEVAQITINSEGQKINYKSGSEQSHKSSDTEEEIIINQTKKFDDLLKKLALETNYLDENESKEEGLLKGVSTTKSNETFKEAPFSALLKYKSIRYKFLICCYLWFSLSFTYYGISMGLKNSKEDIFIDGYIVYAAEGISYVVVGIILSIAFFGRVRSLCLMFFISSISTLAYFFLKYYNLEPYDKILLFIARFGITSIFSVMYTYSTELYPTVIRAKGLGVNTLFARLAAVFVAVVVDLINPFLIYSSLCALAFILSIFLPETFGKELEDEIEEERVIKKVYS